MKFINIVSIFTFLLSSVLLGMIIVQHRLLYQHQTIIELLAAENKNHREDIQSLTEGLILTFGIIQDHIQNSDNDRQMFQASQPLVTPSM